MDNRKLHKILLLGSVIAALFLLAPYFGLHLPSQNPAKSLRRDVRLQLESAGTVIESKRELSVNQAAVRPAGSPLQAAGQKGGQSLSEIEELLK